MGVREGLLRGLDRVEERLALHPTQPLGPAAVTETDTAGAEPAPTRDGEQTR